MSTTTLPQPVSPYGIPIVGEFFLFYVQDPSSFAEEHFAAEWVDEEQGILVITGLKRDTATRTVVASLFVKDKGWTKEKIAKLLEIIPEDLLETKNPLKLVEGKRRKRRKQPPGPVKNLAADRKGIPTFGAYVTPHSVFFPDGTALDRAVVEEALNRRGRR